ncbi:SusC/RagA family TonB-linked outer membrane protein [Chryseobacterium populi]|uniref:TonB-linked outer membrane protein, SusC/RagA family n=1 Tax=Chryseobacterium populi TaxID=1144316 RepID=J3CMC5_9FLAO|nr:SusC/RagA family TonB-linked outer membrane protein [Chryseobacterium populi]EJL74416.1 TonB-linked outer membrane protein, SusC/RagA family [Chryseobacterium populi]
MKNVFGCLAALYLMVFSALNAQQQKVSGIRVTYQAGKTTAGEAVRRFFKKNRIQHVYQEDSLNKYNIEGIKCTDEVAVSCLQKILKGLPFEVFTSDDKVIIIRYKESKNSIGFSQSLENGTERDTIKSTLPFPEKEGKIDEVILNGGYYSVQDNERTGSIAKVAAKEIGNQPVNNVLSAIQGRVSGVNIIQSSGLPGGGYDIQIRGRNSLRSITNSEIDGNQPLYVVDGVPIGGKMASPYSGVVLPGGSINPLNSINPNDIESIEILKDADATAIYGSRGANGVVLITTKKGRSGKLGLNFTSSYALSNSLSNLKLMNTEQYLAVRRQAFANDGISNYPATAYDVNGVWDQQHYTDWPKKLIGNTATSSNSQLSLSGGSNTTTFLLSVGHNEQTTVFMEDFKYLSNTISSSVSHRSEDKRFQMTLSNMFSVQKNNVLRTDMTRQAHLLSPNAPKLYLEDGNLNWENNTFSNPAALFNSTYSNEGKQLLINLNTGYEIMPRLHIKLNGGINYQDFEEMALQPNTMYNPALALGQSSATSRASRSNQDRFSFIVEPQLNWTYKKNSHELDVLLGGTFQSEVNNQGTMTGIGFESNLFIENIGAAQTKIISDQLRSEYRYAAIFGRLNYQYKGRYIINFTGRRDGSSRFGPNNRFANFGAVGAAWLFSKEGFFASEEWLNFGKLRGSYGTAGSDNIGDYQYLDTYIVSSSIYNGVTGLLPSRLYNPDYSWEKTRKLEMALELGLLKNRVNISAAWYRNRSSNQLVGYQLPAVTGFPTVLANLDAMVQNTGWEFEANARPFTGGTFKWETGFNISFPRNKLISFPGLEGSTYANQYEIGQPTSMIKVYHLEGINPLTGQYQFTDYNGDGKISSPDDNKVVENIGVRYFGGWNNTFRYKNWDFSFLIQFVKQRSRNYNNIMPSPGSMNNLPVEALNVWSPENPGGFYMPYHAGVNTSHNLFQNSDAAISDASFIRLKNVQLGYRIPLKNSLFKEVKLYFQGQNLVTWTRYFGLDPEFLFMGFLPPLRTFAFGAEFNL